MKTSIRKIQLELLELSFGLLNMLSVVLELVHYLHKLEHVT